MLSVWPLPCMVASLCILDIFYRVVLHELFADTEAEEVGRDLYHEAHPTVIGATAAAVVPSAALHQLRPIDLVCLQGLIGDHFLGAEAHRIQSPHWTLNLLSGQAKTGQGHRLEAWMVRRAWSLMKMVLLTQPKGEIMALIALFRRNSCCL